MMGKMICLRQGSEAFSRRREPPALKLNVGEMESVLGLTGLLEGRRLQGRHEIETLRGLQAAPDLRPIRLLDRRTGADRAGADRD
jgi:hypothetical protein